VPADAGGDVQSGRAKLPGHDPRGSPLLPGGFRVLVNVPAQGDQMTVEAGRHLVHRFRADCRRRAGARVRRQGRCGAGPGHPDGGTPKHCPPAHHVISEFQHLFLPPRSVTIGFEPFAGGIATQ
jgi:hypothetical protein